MRTAKLRNSAFSARVFTHVPDRGLRPADARIGAVRRDLFPRCQLIYVGIGVGKREKLRDIDIQAEEPLR